MKKIKVKGWKDGKEIIIEPSNLFLGSADFLRVDNICLLYTSKWDMEFGNGTYVSYCRFLCI